MLAIDALVSDLLRSPQDKIRLRGLVEQRLQEGGLSALAAAEECERLMPSVRSALEAAFAPWDSEGVSRPLSSHQAADIHFGVLSVRYEGGLSPAFFDCLSIVQSAGARELVAIAAAYACTLGADRVFYTDGASDGGVDAVARIPRGLGDSAILVMQCKAYDGALSPQVIKAEFARYGQGLEEPVWDEYNKAIGIRDLAVSPGRVFAVFGSKGLSREAGEEARKRGVLAKSPRQLAHSLSGSLGAAAQSRLSKWVDAFPASRTLTRNLALEWPPQP